MRIDLHTHTTASDGLYTPAALLALAKRQKLDSIAITDHDTTSGVEEALQIALHRKPHIIPGIELSAEDEIDGRARDVHILGYFIQLDDNHFQEQLSQFRQDRYQRAEKISQRLEALNMPLAWERIVSIAEGGAIGRPHIARALVEAGYVESIGEAFSRYLYTGGPAYIARRRMSPEEAIALIHSAGGAAVMAHPALVANYLALIRERLVPAGLDGVEVVHPKNPPNDRLNLYGIARQYQLIPTGGSDFHAPEEDGTILLGHLNPPEGCVEALEARAAQR